MCELVQKQYNNSVHEIQLIRSSLESMLAIAGGEGIEVVEEDGDAVVAEGVVAAVEENVLVKPKKSRKSKTAV